MSFMEQVSGLSDFMAKTKELIFGEKNSRLYAILDRYYSLRVEKRPKYIFYAIVSLVVFFVGFIVFYFVSLNNLQSNLNIAILNAQKIADLKSQYVLINQDFTQVTSSLKSNNEPSTLIAALEQKTKERGLETSQLPPSPTLVDLQNTDVLYNKFQIARIEYKLLNASLKQTLDYINALQKMPHKFRVRKIEIHQKFNTKLYFDTDLTVEAYVPSARANE